MSVISATSLRNRPSQTASERLRELYPWQVSQISSTAVTPQLSRSTIKPTWGKWKSTKWARICLFQSVYMTESRHHSVSKSFHTSANSKTTQKWLIKQVKIQARHHRKKSLRKQLTITLGSASVFSAKGTYRLWTWLSEITDIWWLFCTSFTARYTGQRAHASW